MNSYDGRFDISDGWNSKRRDPRFKLSFRYDMTLYLKRASITSYVEIDNILNQKDVVVEYYSLGEEFPEGEINTFWCRGILPVGGITITF